MDVKAGDIYIRESDGKICRVKRVDNKWLSSNQKMEIGEP